MLLYRVPDAEVSHWTNLHWDGFQITALKCQYSRLHVSWSEVKQPNVEIEDPDLSGSVSRYRLFASWTVGTISGNPTAKGDSSLTPTGSSLTADRLQLGEPSLFGSSSAQCQCGTLPFLVPIGFTLFTGRPHGSQKKKGDLVLYSGDLFPTEARKPPSCPRSHSVNRKGKPTHPSAPLVDRCGFTKRLSTVHSR
ncbi:hypothetical protein VNO77_34030 [Canavalia gladiata]|uniref:Uncharacterized protein n=1 Tax=Canavalia gladiata TaxID=3824 RepID=A0AAN9KDK1_CANGL